ncbi:jg17067 [Pararge aegeria aegeria]|uniref:Jg17067 protein n=1 Tax=Pararge aegeria aegeria TaxID=348720 RepID=A0A8S4R4Z0_9NEOP|nr:jg17067 [Pararge aegeria aegeria]
MEAGRLFQIFALRIRNRCKAFCTRPWYKKQVGIQIITEPLGKKVTGELDQTVLEHEIPKARQPCDNAPDSEVNLWVSSSCGAISLRRLAIIRAISTLDTAALNNDLVLFRFLSHEFLLRPGLLLPATLPCWIS